MNIFRLAIGVAAKGEKVVQDRLPVIQSKFTGIWVVSMAAFASDHTKKVLQTILVKMSGEDEFKPFLCKTNEVF